MSSTWIKQQKHECVRKEHRFGWKNKNWSRCSSSSLELPVFSNSSFHCSMFVWSGITSRNPRSEKPERFPLRRIAILLSFNSSLQLQSRGQLRNKSKFVSDESNFSTGKRQNYKCRIAPPSGWQTKLVNLVTRWKRGIPHFFRYHYHYF